MWQYVNESAELNFEEHAHVMECAACASVFCICVLALTPKEANFDLVEQRDEKPPYRQAS